jgi:antitoxin MazE
MGNVANIPYGGDQAMSQAIIGRWGKSLAVRFPAEVAKAAGLGDGECVEVVEQEGQVVIRKTSPSVTVEEMFRGKTPEAWQELYSDAFDGGPDRGREIVEE